MGASTTAGSPLGALLGFVLLTTGTLVQANTMLTELKVCAQPGMHTLVSLVCPPDYLVIVASASYRRSHELGCHPSLEDSCLASDVSSQLTMPCFFRLGTCKIKLLASNMPQCSVNGVPYEGQPYFHVLYKCEPLMLSSNPMSQTVDMCSDTDVSGSLVYLWNTHFPQYTTCRTCRCVVHVQLNTHVQVTMPHFKAHRQPTNTNCPQVIHFWSGSEVRSVCSEVDDSFEPLQLNVETTLYIEFDNPQRKLTQFWITLGVHHSQTMTVQCGSRLVFPPRPVGSNRGHPGNLPHHSTHGPTTSGPWTRWGVGGTLGPTPSTSKPPFIQVPTEPLQAAQHAHSIGYIPIIAAVLGATLVIVIIIMVVIFGCKKRRKRDRTPPPAPSTDAVGDYAFDNDIYMTEATRRSNQKPHPTPLAPDPPPSVTEQKHHDDVITVTTPPPRKFLALEAPKGTVVPNPYAGLPVDSPRHLPAYPSNPNGKKTAADYEDLTDFDQSYKGMLKKGLQTDLEGVAETKLELP